MNDDAAAEIREWYGVYDDLYREAYAQPLRRAEPDDSRIARLEEQIERLQARPHARAEIRDARALALRWKASALAFRRGRAWTGLGR